MALAQLWGAAVLLLGVPAPPLPSGTRAASSHSLRYFYTGVSEPGQGLPRFVQGGYVDDQPITHYDSSTRRKRPAAPWMEKVDADDPQYWERGTRKLHSAEQAFRESLATLQGYHNQSGGLHTLQWMFGCELGSDGSKTGYMHFGYDGSDYLSLDKEHLRWMAADDAAQITKMKWEIKPAIAQGFKAYLEGECVEWLRRYLGYRKETLLRTEPPEVKVTRHKSSTEDMETLVCQAHGFYPREIKATWTRAGESREQETFRDRVAPNPDGTYYILLYTDIEPEERGLYRCHVDHAGLSQPLVLAWEGPAGNVGLVAGVIRGALVLLLLVVVTIIIVIVMNRQQVMEGLRKLRGAISFIEEEQRARELLTQELNKLQTTSSSTWAVAARQSEEELESHRGLMEETVDAADAPGDQPVREAQAGVGHSQDGAAGEAAAEGHGPLSPPGRGSVQ